MKSDIFLIKNGLIVTGNDDDDVFEGDILIEKGKISEVAPHIDPHGLPSFDAARFIIIPGLIQTHVHLCQTLLRNLADDLPLFEWLQEKIWPYEGKLTPESLRISARLGIAELLMSGTTTIMDFGTVHHMDVVFEELLSSGIRAFCGKTMMDHEDMPSSLRENTHQALETSLDLLDRWHEKGNGRIRYAFAPRFIPSCSKKLLMETVRLTEEYKSIFHTHAAETEEEVNWVIRNHNERCISFFDRIGASSQSLCLAHCIWLNDREKDILASNKIKVLHCPGSNLKLGSGIAPIPEYIDKGITVSLGTDGAPCNNTLDLFKEMHLAALIQKPRYGPTAMNARTVFRMATRNGASTLGLVDRIGSIEREKNADIVFLARDAINSIPFDNIYAKLVYSTNFSSVVHVMVDGEWVLKDRIPVNINLAELIEDVHIFTTRFK